MKRFDLNPTDPQAALEKLETERSDMLSKIKNPIARLAVRATGAFGHGVLAENTWQISHTKKKIVS